MLPKQEKTYTIQLNLGLYLVSFFLFLFFLAGLFIMEYKKHMGFAIFILLAAVFFVIVALMRIINHKNGKPLSYITIGEKSIKFKQPLYFNRPVSIRFSDIKNIKIRRQAVIITLVTNRRFTIELLGLQNEAKKEIKELLAAIGKESR